MTPLHRILYTAGYTDCKTSNGKTAALHHVPGGIAVRTGLQADAEGITWEAQSTHRDDDQRMVQCAKAALTAWVQMQESAEAVQMES